MLKLKFLVAFIFVFLFYSCQFDNAIQYNAGNELVNDPVKVIMIDTLRVNTYLTGIDSVSSSQNDRFMVGRTDNNFGIVTTCESYFRIDPNSGLDLRSTSVFDSARLILNLDGYTFGDTTKICKMEIYRLTENITVNEETGFIYNTTQFAHEKTPLATFSVDLTKEKLDSVTINFNEFGKEMYDLVKNNDSLIKVNGDNSVPEFKLFKDKYKGFIIKPADDNTSCVVGFVADPNSASSPSIEIYYHDNTIVDNLSFSLQIEATEKYNSNTSSTSLLNYYGSNYFSNNYSAFINRVIPTGVGKLASTETKNMIFLQGGMNLCVRIELPTIDKLHYLGIGSVIKAELIFEPVSGTFAKKSDLPTNLEMYLVNNKNQKNNQLSLVGSSDMAYAVLHYNNEFKNETYYSFDVTKYVVDEYLSVSDPYFSLLMTLPQNNINDNVDQLIIGDQNHPTNKMKLKVYMATY